MKSLKGKVESQWPESPQVSCSAPRSKAQNENLGTPGRKRSMGHAAAAETALTCGNDCGSDYGSDYAPLAGPLRTRTVSVGP
jgi:hypothetical protein